MMGAGMEVTVVASYVEVRKSRVICHSTVVSTPGTFLFDAHKVFVEILLGSSRALSMLTRIFGHEFHLAHQGYMDRVASRPVHTPAVIYFTGTEKAGSPPAFFVRARFRGVGC